MAIVRYRFRDLVLDPAARELTRDGEQVVLPGRSLDCLVYLIEHRDRAVGRDELIAAVWGRVDIADGLLAQTILRLRRGLGDSGSDGAVRTVARFGYRWVEETTVDMAGSAPMEPPAPNDVSADDDPMPASPAVAGRRRSVGLLAGAAAIAALVALAATWLAGGPFGPDTAPTAVTDPAPDRAEASNGQRQSAMVLPVRVLEQAEWAWLRLGLMEMIGNRLRDGGVPTMPSENVLAVLLEAEASMAALAERSGALVVQPEIRHEGGLWRSTLVASSGIEVEAVAADPVDAAVAAADVLLIRLGQPVPEAAAGSRPLALEQLLLRLRAAILAEQFETARELIDRAPEPLRAEPEVELEHARIDQGQGRYEAAEQRLLALLERLPTGAVLPETRGRVLAALGGIQFRRLNFAAAEDSFAEAIALLDGSGEHAGLAQAFVGRAAIASRNEELDAAAADLGRARTEMDAGGDLVGVAQIDMNLALIQIKRYRPASGLPLLREAESRFVAMGAREQLAYVRYLVAGVQLQTLDLEGASATMASLSPPERHTGNERLRWRLALTRVFVLTATGQLTPAETELDRILAGAVSPDDAAIAVGARTMRALVANVRQVDPATTRALGRTLSAELRRLRPDMYVTAWIAYQRGLRQAGEDQEARRQTEAFATYIQANPNPWRQVQRALALAEQAWHERPDEQALDLFATAFDLAQQLAIPDDLVHVAEPYGMALLAHGDVDRASAVIGRVAAWADQDLRAAWAQAMLFRAQGRDQAYQRALDRVDSLRGERPLPALPPP